MDREDVFQAFARGSRAMGGFQGEVLHYKHHKHPVSNELVEATLINGDGVDLTDLIYNWRLAKDVETVMNVNQAVGDLAVRSWSQKLL